MRLPLISGICLTVLSGCASSPQFTDVLVSTNPPGASCVLSRPVPPAAAPPTAQLVAPPAPQPAAVPIATAGPTPAIALVGPDEGTLLVLCRRPGFADAAATLPVPAGASPGDQRSIDIALLPLPR
ncbi:MAG TPA: hypothetical protein VHY35_20295 [Stellaceae bacterium]|jgi:hypothetical protein|nr:hypothetical protein [Stellaceae bacterium]